MNISMLTLLAALLILCMTLSPAFGSVQSFLSGRQIDKKVKSLDESTRKRVLAMQQAGMPAEAIASKIKYEVGSAGTARRMLEKINVEETKKAWVHQQKQRYTNKKSINMNRIAAERKAYRNRA